MTSAQFTIDRLYTKDLYVNGAQITHPDLAALLTDHPSNNVGIGTNDPKVKLDINGTNALRLPAGNKTSDRPSVADSDYCIRYNTDDNIFEGYSNGAWGSLGGVTSINQKVTITADNNDGLQFYTSSDGVNSIERMHILNNGQVNIGSINDVESVINSKAATTYVDTQITNLVGGAPGALDTLNELAAALGDDANYATTVTNSLALKAPLASPSFTGSVGIGTSSPSAKLQISDSQSGSDPSQFLLKLTARGDIDHWTGIALGEYYDVIKSGIIHQRKGSYGRGTMHFCTQNVSDSTDVTVSDSKMCIDMNGNVGIGKTNPGHELDVVGTIKASTALIVGSTNVASALNQKAPLASPSFTGNVGIGTNTPGTILEVKEIDGPAAITIVSNTTDNNSSDVDVRKSIIYFGNSSEVGNYQGNKAGIFCSHDRDTSSTWATQKFDFCIENTNDWTTEVTLSDSKMTILSDGNVGIGTDSPSTPLHIYTDDVAAGCFITLEADGTGGSGGNSFSGITFKTNDGSPINPTSSEPTYISGKIISGWPDDGNQWTWGKKAFIKFQTPSGTSQTGALVDVMTIQGGNVGIGETSPGEKLDVDGTVKATSFITSHINITSYKINQAAGILSLQDSNNRNLIFCKNSTGNVGIGTDSPSYKLDVNGQVRIGSNVFIKPYYWVQHNGSGDKFYPNEGLNGWVQNGGANGYGPGIAFKYTGYTSTIHFEPSVSFGGSADTDNDHKAYIKSNGYIYTSGRLGVNKTSPGWPIHAGSGNSSGYTSMYLFDSSRDRKYYSSTYLTVSIKSDNYMWAQGFFHSSDERIKKNIVDVPDDLSLEMIRKIPCRYYEYKDNVKRGNDKTIGFIAQEVMEVMPLAVDLQNNYIPNEMRTITDVSWNNTTLYSDISDCSGIKYLFYVSNDPSSNSFEKEVIGNADNSFTFDNSYNIVFCYGKEVDDFHTVDKDKLFALNFSATQEIDKIQQAEKAKLATAETKLAAAETEIATLKTQLAAVLARLDALENA